MSIPSSATDLAAVTVAAAASETTTCPPSSVDVDMFLELYRTSANANEVMRRQNVWLERMESERGGGGRLHLTGKKKNRDWMVDGDDEDGEKKCDYAEEMGVL